MKKILGLGLLAVCLAMSERPASAWVNSKFGIGLNWNWQSGGNNFLWGLFRNGQPPGPGCDGPCGPGFGGAGFGGPGYGPGCPGGACPGGMGGGGFFPGLPPAGAIYGPQDFQFFGRQPSAQPNNTAEVQQNQQYAQPTSYRATAYYPYQNYPYQAVNYYPANGNNYWNPYSFGFNVGR